MRRLLSSLDQRRPVGQDLTPESSRLGIAGNDQKAPVASLRSVIDMRAARSIELGKGLALTQLEPAARVVQNGCRPHRSAYCRKQSSAVGAQEQTSKIHRELYRRLVGRRISVNQETVSRLNEDRFETRAEPCKCHGWVGER